MLENSWDSTDENVKYLLSAEKLAQHLQYNIDRIAQS
jgi:hypothetical protein